jgi:DNA-binding GntR family transcriptional regulator
MNCLSDRELRFEGAISLGRPAVSPIACPSCHVQGHETVYFRPGSHFLGPNVMESLFSVVPLEKTQVLSERVYKAILQMLARGALKRGSTLRIDLLAKALDVSPTPVREALARLATTGLVLHESRKGYTVAPPISRGQLTELMQARGLIEVGSIALACRQGGSDFQGALNKALKMQKEAVVAFHAASDATLEEREILAWNVMESDLHFHQVIFDNTCNRYYSVMSDVLCGQLHRVRQSVERGISDDMSALAEHQAILDAVLAKDCRAAEQAMTLHMTNVEQRSAADLSDEDDEEAVPQPSARKPRHRD